MAADKVKVQTSDKDIVDVDLSVAKQWGPIKAIYEAFGGLESPEKPIELEKVDTPTLKKILEWTDHHKADGLNSVDGETPKKSYDFSDWDKTFLQVKQETIFEIMLAAYYLDIQPLLDLTCKTVANMIKDKTPEQVRETFKIPNDLPPFEQPQEIPNEATGATTTA